jgi:hypothetical protein
LIVLIASVVSVALMALMTGAVLCLVLGLLGSADSVCRTCVVDTIRYDTEKMARICMRNKLRHIEFEVSWSIYERMLNRELCDLKER